MPTAWFIVPYTRKIETDERPNSATRWVDINNQQATIAADGGRWGEVEVLGNRAVVKVVTNTQAVLDNLANPYLRIPLSLLATQLNQLTTTQRNRIHTELNNMGYSDPEIQAALNLSGLSAAQLGTKTLGDVLRFAASRRQVARFDSVSQNFILDGPIQACESVDALDTSTQ